MATSWVRCANTHQRQAGEVGAGNQQDEAYREHQHHELWPHIAAQITRRVAEHKTDTRIFWYLSRSVEFRRPYVAELYLGPPPKSHPA